MDPKRIDWRVPLGGLLIAAALLALTWIARTENPDRGTARWPSQAPTVQPSRVPEPLVPTPLPPARRTSIAQTGRSITTPIAPVTSTTAFPSATATEPVKAPPSALQEPAFRQAQGSFDLKYGILTASARGRIGVGLTGGAITDYPWDDHWPGWYLNWRVMRSPAQPAGVRFVQMVRVSGDAFRPDAASIQAAARANPGALWLVGNEPDVIWQDNATPEEYATAYQAAYAAIKAADASAQIAIGGVSQPTPLRLEYLDRVLAAYRARFGSEMPVDVWNAHAFILREERDSWGVGIPPGLTQDQGRLYEIADHADMTIFRRQIEDFRRWMAARGFQDKPLIITEYGVLMPESYGFPPALVGEFMTATFDFFLSGRDAAIGYPADDNRLVQAFCWYSVADTVYPTSNLFDPETREITSVGEAFRSYVERLR